MFWFAQGFFTAKNPTENKEDKEATASITEEVLTWIKNKENEKVLEWIKKDKRHLEARASKKGYIDNSEG